MVIKQALDSLWHSRLLGKHSGFHRHLSRVLDGALRTRIRYLDAERPRRHPSVVQIAATSRCNLRCPSCSHALHTDRGSDIAPGELRQILSRLPFSPSAVVLNGIGEPLLNPDYFELVDVLAERGLRCRFITNGTLLGTRAIDSILSRGNIHEIHISCDGATRATFEALRVGANFEKWKARVQAFLAAVNRRSPPHPLVVCDTVVSRRNLPELGAIIDLCGRLGFHRVLLLRLIPVGPDSEALVPSDQELASLDMPGLRRLAADLGIVVEGEAHEPRGEGDLACLQPWEYMMVQPGGLVRPCCAVFGADRASVMGNLLEQEFEDIWHGPRFRRFRSTLAAGTNPLCRACPYS